MVFSSPTFLYFFLPLFLLAYFAFRTVAARNLVLVGFSLVFYAWGEPLFVFVLLASIGVNWIIGLRTDAASAGRRRAWLTLGLVWNLGILAVAKYAAFAVQGVNAAFGDWMGMPGWELPLGVSFFSFHAVSYLMDVYRRNAPAERSLMRLTLYITMFPQLVAGPIVRYRKIARQLSERRATVWRASVGVRIFAIGMAQKVLIANQVGVIADTAFSLGPALDPSEAWMGIVCYTLQIYFDFAGYSNMAIGLALIVGLAFPRNFDRPYTSQSITEFWRRWHISLSSWFRDYLYIPLGGNRRGEMRTYLNLVIVFLLCGLWHGASWNFVIWGAWYGGFLVIERAWLLSRLQRLPWRLGTAYALFVVILGWVWFRAETLSDSLDYFAALFGQAGNGLYDVNMLLLFTPYRSFVIVLAIAIALWPEELGKARVTAGRRVLMAQSGGAVGLRLAGNSVWFALFCLAMLTIAGSVYNPFLYFRF